MKKLLALMLTFVMLVSMMAIPAAAAAENEPVTIRIMWWGDTARHEKYNQIMDAFQETYPWITVERESATWADYWNKLATLVAGGNAPDVMGMHAQFVSDYANRGALLNLQPYMDDGTIGTADIAATVLQNGVVGGLMCMIPMGLTAQTNIVNMTLLEEVGFEYPTDHIVTWEEFAQLCKDFRVAAQAKGIDAWLTGEITGYTQFQYWCRGRGSDLYTPEGELGFTAEDAATWYAYWKDLREADAIPDAATTAENGSLTLEQNVFCTQRVAMYSIPVNQLWQYAAQLPNNTIVPVNMPLGNDGTNASFVEGAGWAASANIDEAHQKAAALLLDFLANKEGAAQFMQMDQGVPINSKMVDYIKPLLSEANVTAMDYVQNIASMDDLKPINYAPKGATGIDTVYNEMREAVAFGTMSAEDAGAAVIEQATAIINENK